MPKESVLTDNEKASFEIKIYISIIIEGALQPIYLDEVILEPEQIEFFKKDLLTYRKVSNTFLKTERSRSLHLIAKAL